MSGTKHTKASNIAIEYKKIEPLSVKWIPSSSEEDANREEATSNDGGSPRKHDGQASANPLASSIGVLIEDEPPSKT